VGALYVCVKKGKAKNVTKRNNFSLFILQRINFCAQFFTQIPTQVCVYSGATDSTGFLSLGNLFVFSNLTPNLAEYLIVVR
jgi:hypothetical protein